MAVTHRTGIFNFADFLELVREDQKADLLDGVIHMAFPESTEHNDLIRWLTGILGGYVDERELGRITVNKVAFRLTPTSAPEPDIAFIRAERMDAIKRGYVDGPPDLAVEIVSSESALRDYEEKRRLYEASGVGEYWIIDPEEQRALFLVRDAARFIESPAPEHVFASRVLPGLRLDVRWLWQRPLPKTRSVLEQLLAVP